MNKKVNDVLVIFLSAKGSVFIFLLSLNTDSKNCVAVLSILITSTFLIWNVH